MRRRILQYVCLMAYADLNSDLGELKNTAKTPDDEPQQEDE